MARRSEYEHVGCVNGDNVGGPTIGPMNCHVLSAGENVHPDQAHLHALHLQLPVKLLHHLARVGLYLSVI